MKKIYFLFLACLPLFGKAQTITQNDLPTAGLAWINAVDTIYTDAILPGGSGQTWDLSASLSRDIDDTVGFIAAAGIPYASFFGGSNLAAYDDSSNSYTFFTTNSTGFYVDGFVSGAGSVFNFTPGQLYVPVPMSFGSTQNSSSRLAVDTVVSGNNIRFARTTQSTFNADGSGTLIIPSGTHSNVLRIRITEIAFDTIYTIFSGFPIAVSNSVSQTTTFRYVQPGTQPSLIATVYADSLGDFATSAEYYNNVSTAVSEVVQENISVYPSPADKYITFTTANNADGKISILDQTGKIVYSATIEGVQKTIETSQLADGVYFYQISGKTSAKGKFTVRH